MIAFWAQKVQILGGFLRSVIRIQPERTREQSEKRLALLRESEKSVHVDFC